MFVDDDIDRGDTYSRADLGDKSRAESIFDDSKIGAPLFFYFCFNLIFDFSRKNNLLLH